MSLVPGVRLGVYEIVALIGAGGMGEVYRARDTRLNRDVAIKVLPGPFAADAERVARFEREAQVLALLNHQNIAHIHGLEDASGIRALVLEFVEGPTLADRIDHGAIPLDETLAIARQITSALDAAHQNGVIHRDLKPANIKLRPDGTVKVLDFGLAKALTEQPTNASASMSPTITSPAMMTGGGVILGTAAYMSPEQARGKTADKRADIWAFGCVLYEMLTGKRLFAGEEVSDTLAAILRADPDWRALPPNTPVAARRLLRRCLEKDRTKRLADFGDAQIEIDDALHPVDEPALASNRPAGRSLMWLGTAVAAVAVASAIALAVVFRTETESSKLLRASIILATNTAFASDQVALAISPDGSRIAYRSVKDGVAVLFVRQLDQLTDSVVRGSDRADSPFFSPDGQWIGFFADQHLKKTPVAGGTAITICKVTGVGRGAAWNEQGSIIFATGGTPGLWKVSADGGEPQSFTNPQVGPTSGHKLPSFLPGGEWVLFVEGVQAEFDDGRILAKSVVTGEEREIYRGGSAPKYSPTGHLIVARTGSLWAIPLDIKSIRAIGPPVEIESGVFTRTNNGVAHYDFTSNGLLVYAPRIEEDGEMATVAWVDRQGGAVEIPDLKKPVSHARLSPDNSRVALTILGDVWIYEFARRILTRLTTGSAREIQPTWTPDGRRVAYTVNNSRIFWKPIDGSVPEEVLVQGGAPGNFPRSWTPDGRALVFQRGTGAGFNDLWLVPVDGDRQPRPFIESAFNETGAAVSPDGKLIAYESNESGRDEIYLRVFTGGGKVQISAGGGTAPAWSADGQDLFYHSDAGLMVVRVTAASQLKVSSARLLLAAAAGILGGVSTDGRRFLMLKRDAARTLSHFTLVSGWFEEIRKKTSYP